MRRLIAFFLLVTVLAICLSGCQKYSDNTVETPLPPQPQQLR